MLKTLLIFLAATPTYAAIGDKLVGTWTGAGNVDEYSTPFPAQPNGRRQALSACRNVTVKVATDKNRLKLDLNYNCGGALPSGNSSFNYQLRDVAGRPFREVVDAGPPEVVVGRIFDDGLDLIEEVGDDEGIDLTGVLITLTNARNIRFRLNWSELGPNLDSFNKYLTAPLRK